MSEVFKFRKSSEMSIWMDIAQAGVRAGLWPDLAIEAADRVIIALRMRIPAAAEMTPEESRPMWDRSKDA